MVDQLVLDIVRVGHLAAFAIGLGAAVFLELTVFHRARLYVGDEELALVEQGHHLIFQALLGLWLTGLALLAIRTGLDPTLVSAKVVMKLVVVSALTLNAALIARVAMPVLRSCHGGCLGDLELRPLLTIGAAAGFSAACWGSALVLGAVTYLKSLPLMVLAPGFATILLGGAAAGAAYAHVIGRREPEFG